MAVPRDKAILLNDNLLPNSWVKSDSNRHLQSGNITIADVDGLSTALSTVVSVEPVCVVPKGDFSNYTKEGLKNYLLKIQDSPDTEVHLGKIRANIVGVPDCRHPIFSPINKRIYYIPSNSLATSWYYYDCIGGWFDKFNSNTSGVPDVQLHGGTYIASLDRIYLNPYRMTANAAETFFYIDCKTATVVQFARPLDALASWPYTASVYSPRQNRLYYIPAGQAQLPNWHFIDLSVGDGTTITSYSHLQNTLVEDAYYGGAYSPSEDKIYFSPCAQANQAIFHRIDCATGLVESYPNPFVGLFPLDDYAFNSAYLDGINNKIYFLPFQIDFSRPLIRIDCDTGVAEQYGTTHATLSNWGFGGAVVPCLNRIYIVPNVNSGSRYIDMNLGIMVDDNKNALTESMPADPYFGAIFDPVSSRVMYSAKGNVGNTYESFWHYLTVMTDKTVNPTLITSLYNRG